MCVVTTNTKACVIAKALKSKARTQKVEKLQFHKEEDIKHFNAISQHDIDLPDFFLDKCVGIASFCHDLHSMISFCTILLHESLNAYYHLSKLSSEDM